MSRIRTFYERRFRDLLAKMDPLADPTRGFAEAERMAADHGLKQNMAWALTHADLRRSVGETKTFPHKFFCDVGLGGLTRWLRGAGYEAMWKPNLDDAEVIRQAQSSEATLVTTDSLMTERGVLRDGLLPWVWVPSSLTCEEQLIIVLRELALPLRESRCMRCGGLLRRVDKTDVACRIPPRTAIWLNDYFVCSQCDQLFWRGTHWKRIDQRLRRLYDVSTSIS